MRGVLLVLLAVVFGAAACGGSGSGSEANAPVAVSRPADLTSVDQLREAFEADEGVARLVLLLSPT